MPQTTSVIALSASGPSAPSFRVRALMLRSELAKSGVHIEPSPLFTADESRAFGRAGILGRLRISSRARTRLRSEIEASTAPVALVSRQVDLLPSLALERRAARGRRLIYDVDDAIWQSWRRQAGGHRLAFLKAAPLKARWLAQNASVVIAGNDILADWLSGHSGQVHVVPSVVETRGMPVRQHEARAELVVGWIGSPTTARFLRRVIGPLEQTAKALTGRRLRLLIVGGPAVALAGVTCEAVPWSPEQEVRALARVDVGLMPLPDDPWTRGKCAYKAIQYMGAGIPVIADDVGVTADVLGGSEAGRVVGSPVEWQEALIDLLSDVALRARLGGQARRRVEASYSVQRWVPELAKIIAADS